ncbi:MAG TPA: dienelactone hydrolase family protein [Xanthomonadaceae bacterium]|nr:dienelactone hydrolase family protein [Xanthomonadaceae bacterium]
MGQHIVFDTPTGLIPGYRADPHIPPESVQQHRELQPDADFHLYPAGHGFNCEARPDYDPDSAALALERTLAFLEHALR